MRVIGGIYRSRLLAAPPGHATRPTSDRLRETLFNVLAPRLPGCRFADLYAGSGAVGIEASSRGAAHVLFVEKGPPAIAAIRANLAGLKITFGFTIESRSVEAVLKRLVIAGTVPQFDIIFIDPPWEAAADYTATLTALGGAAAHLLAEQAVVVAEHASRDTIADRYGSLRKTRTLQQGDAALTFYAAESDGATSYFNT